MIKRVAMFIGDLKVEYNYNMLDAFSKKAEEEHFALEVFQVFEIYGSNILFTYGEREISKIPDLSLYDAVAVLPDTFLLNGHEKNLIALFREHPEVPVFSIRKGLEGTYNILVDDYSSMYAMVSHFIRMHQCKRIAFMQGRMELKDANDRYQAYLDAMRDNNIPIGEWDVFEGNYWKNMAVPALDHFLKESVPDAIICANDYMAVSIIEELKNRGYKVPEDVKVSGYDDVLEAKTVAPSLTTVGISTDAICNAFFQTATELSEGKEMKHEIYTASSSIYRASCSCTPESELSLLKKKAELYGRVEEYRTVINQATFLYLNLDNAKTFRDALLTLPVHFQYFSYTGRVFFCFNTKSSHDGPYSEDMVLRGIVSSAGAEECNIYFKRVDILPKQYDCPIKIIVNLHIKDECFGYLVCEGPLQESFPFFLQILSQGIINWQDKYHITMENFKLSVDSRNDGLTNLPNRKTIDEEINKVYTKMLAGGPQFFLCSIDMDGLKEINDTYGHMEGDKALYTLAGILAAEMGDLGVVGRLGGDEFMSFYLTEDETVVKSSILNIQNKIQTFNENSKRPYKLSVSIGYAKCTPDSLLTNSIQDADNRMYEEKRKKKCSREYKEESESAEKNA